MDNKFKVPTLDRNNPTFWKMALESTATTINALDHITGTPPEPTDPALLADYNKKKHTLRALILNTVPSYILNLLRIDTDPSPNALLTAILIHLQTNTTTDHKYLKSEAENLRFTTDMSFDDYVSKHNSLRARMIASQFPNITDETTTVEFLIDGLRYNPDTIDIGRQLLAINPTTVKDFSYHFHRLRSYNMPAPSMTTSTIYPPLNPFSQPPPTRYLPTQLQTRRQPYIRQPLPPGFRPGSFHQQFMRAPPNHTDQQCRDTRHPKFNRTPTTKNQRPQQQPRANHVTKTNIPGQEPNSNQSFNLFPPPLPPNWTYPSYPYDATTLPQEPPGDKQAHDNQVDGMFALDSAAHPTHISTPPPSLPQNSLSTRTAANQLTRCTHAGPIKIRLHPNHPPLRAQSVATPSLHTNLLSVRDTSSQYGAVLFTPHQAYILNLHDPTRPLVVSTAPWRKNCYLLRSLPSSDTQYPPHALGARTVIRSTSAKNKNTNKPKHRFPAPILRQTPALPSIRLERPASTPRLDHIPPPHDTPLPNPTAQSFYHWHVVLNHLNLNKLRRMGITNTLPILPTTLCNTPPSITCSTCPPAKQKPNPHPRQHHQYAFGSYISSDTCGPFKPRSRHGNVHFVSYIDSRSRYLIVFFIPDRTVVQHTTPLAITFITAKHGKTPSIYRSDNAGEFQSNAMNHFYNEHGIQYRSNTPHQPQENSLAERINQTLVTSTRAALHHAQLDQSFWEDAMKDVIFK